MDVTDRKRQVHVYKINVSKEVREWRMRAYIKSKKQVKRIVRESSGVDEEFGRKCREKFTEDKKEK